ncbi:transcription antitermination factor NusB [Candidatus Beckwithbacteria bacterium]|nr:transcription antitermination factor NusB [Candidatus Beckwithbacteria bacterium]
MKVHQDPRHQKRIEKFQKLFSYSFRPETYTISEDIKPIIDKLIKIDDYIQKTAPEWPIAKLNKTDLAILRLSIYELLFEENIPPKVVIDEAIEIGKEYGSENTAKFINGVLGGILNKKIKKDSN